MFKRIGILGSTGSIGTQALDVVRSNIGNFKVDLLSSNKSIDLLKNQIEEFQPKYIGISDSDTFKKVNFGDFPNCLLNNDLDELIRSSELDVLVTSVVGSVGLRPTVTAIKKGIDVALANKETLVMAGNIIMDEVKKNKVKLYPIDSEHSAIWQAIDHENHDDIESIWLTCSGGPFRGKKRSDLINISKEQALKHPTWTMGAKISIDSATLINKGLELIEACHLFNIDSSKIKILIHPESIIHSMVQFKDGNIIAELGSPDMRIPIQYALMYPSRPQNDYKRINFYDLKNLSFDTPDTDTFETINLAYQAIKDGGLKPAVLNIANEILVEAFLKDKIKFLDIINGLKNIYHEVENISNPTLEDILNMETKLRINLRQRYKL